jgi:hypothetical protein
MPALFRALSRKRAFRRAQEIATRNRRFEIWQVNRSAHTRPRIAAIEWAEQHAAPAVW